jgi:RHS repeat-associated protein
VIRHDYYTFGEDAQPLAGDPLRYAGKELDPETAQEYFGARYYRNVWGRFGTVDPVFSSAAMADPQQWNRYAYARNNPLTFSDPFGATVTYDQSCSSLGAVDDDDKAPPTWVTCSGNAGGGGGSDPNLPYGQEYTALPYMYTGLAGETSDVFIVHLPGDWCAEGTTPDSSYGPAYPCPVAPSPLLKPHSSTTHLSNAPSSDLPAARGSGGGGGGGGQSQGDKQINEVARGIFRPPSCSWMERFSDSHAMTRRALAQVPQKLAAFMVGKKLASAIGVPTLLDAVAWARTEGTAASIVTGAASVGFISGAAGVIATVTVGAGLAAGAAIDATVFAPCSP